jgi:hypothetical protein
MKKIIPVFAPVLLALLALASCADYAYRHHVSGRILDMNGQPVAGALVKRVTDRKSERQYGSESVYLQKTDMKGKFVFSFQGRGPKPEPRGVWTFVVTHPDFIAKEVSFTIPWTDAEKPNFGYNLDGLEIRMTKAR